MNNVSESESKVFTGSQSQSRKKDFAGVGVRVEKRIWAESELKIYARHPTSSVAQKSD